LWGPVPAQFEATAWRSRITIEAGKRSGQPCIRGLRITVSDVLELFADRFPGSPHVRTAGLASADADEIWRYVQQHGLVIVSRDDDFRQRSALLGAPPRVIWLRVGNGSTTEIEQVLRSRELDVHGHSAGRHLAGDHAAGGRDRAVDREGDVEVERVRRPRLPHANCAADSGRA
jgi:predicted nuclease of predicted toxin-antitoxin system